MNNRFLTTRKLRASVAQEKQIARDVGGRRVAGSGSMPGNKGDVKEDEWLIEAKMTVSGRYSLTLQTWRKIEREAAVKGKRPVIIVKIAGRSLAVIDYHDFLALKGGDGTD